MYSMTTGSLNSFVGYFAGNGILTGESNSGIGQNCGSTYDSSFCSFLGREAKNNAGGYSYCTVIGSGATGTGNNRVILGRSSDKVFVPGSLDASGTTALASATFTGTLNTISTTVFGYISGLTSSAQTQISNILNGTTPHTGTVSFANISTSGTALVEDQYIHLSAAPITGTFTVASPYYEIYPVAPAGAFTITLPTPAAALIGIKITFRRTNTNTSAITSSAYYPLTSNSATTTALLTASATTAAGNSITLCCLQNSATPTYAWMAVA
jgi:hypothetical protein